jgi:prolyl-tRNA synthetase, family II
MRRSRYFLPTSKENPKEAQIASHQLMLRAGMIEQSSAGIYSWLPLGTAVLKNIEQIIRDEQNKIGAQEILMPTIQSAELWRESGRFDAYGQEMLRFKDRHDRDMLYTPTAEELVTDIARHHLKSYRDLPCCLYQIQWKFRDEIRPRFGVMRGREFFMKDAYSIDLDQDTARETYKAMMRAYVRTFRRMGITAVPVRADSGPIGGNLSHEFQVIAKTGESALFYEARLETLMNRQGDHVDVDEIMSIYAAAEEMHNPDESPVPESELKQARGIEVGHIFYIGTKYTDVMGLSLTGPNNDMIVPHMGCYGIGVSRLVGAIIEACHDDNGIIWPESVAPFKVGLININPQDAATTEACEAIYQNLQAQGITVLYDDRDERPGVKFAEMELIGLPWQVRVGPKGVAAGKAELKNRKSGEMREVALETVMSEIQTSLSA